MLGAYAEFIGKAVIYRTAAYHYIGRLQDVGPDYFVFTELVYLADTPNWSEFLANGEGGELEPWPNPDDRVIVGRGLQGDMSLWRHEIPRTRR